VNATRRHKRGWRFLLAAFLIADAALTLFEKIPPRKRTLAQNHHLPRQASKMLTSPGVAAGKH